MVTLNVFVNSSVKLEEPHVILNRIFERNEFLRNSYHF
jgi:hypothetical protein